MSDNGTPVVIIFIITIGVILYNYVGRYIEINEELRGTIARQELVIEKKTKENKAMAELVSYLYYQHTGKQVPNTWTPIPRDGLSPVH